MNRPLTLFASTLVALAGCRTTASDNEVPARISNPSDASRAALQQAVNAALHTEVLLAEDALTTSSILIIERNPPATMRNEAAGRRMDPPIQFRLIANDAACILVDTRDDSRYLLENTTCVAE